MLLLNDAVRSFTFGFGQQIHWISTGIDILYTLSYSSTNKHLVHRCSRGLMGSQFEQAWLGREHCLLTCSLHTGWEWQHNPVPLSPFSRVWKCNCSHLEMESGKFILLAKFQGWYKISCSPVMRDREGGGKQQKS